MRAMLTNKRGREINEERKIYTNRMREKAENVNELLAPHTTHRKPKWDLNWSDKKRNCNSN